MPHVQPKEVGTINFEISWKIMFVKISENRQESGYSILTQRDEKLARKTEEIFESSTMCLLMA